MRSHSLLGLLLACAVCAVNVPHASAQLAMPAWMQVRGTQEESATAPQPIAERAKDVGRSSWFLAIGAGLLAGGMIGAAAGAAMGCKSEGMSLAVPLGALVGTGGLVLTVHGAVELSRLGRRQPLPKNNASSVVLRSLAIAAATTGLLVATSIPTAERCIND